MLSCPLHFELCKRAENLALCIVPFVCFSISSRGTVLHDISRDLSHLFTQRADSMVRIDKGSTTSHRCEIMLDNSTFSGRWKQRKCRGILKFCKGIEMFVSSVDIRPLPPPQYLLNISKSNGRFIGDCKDSINDL